MSDERTNNDPDGVGDALVSRTYRELADERAPASLNESVLRDATASAAPGYARSIQWLRPMAWAATIGLCLVIVVEQTMAPMPDVPAVDTGIYSSSGQANDSESLSLRLNEQAFESPAAETVPEPDKIVRDLQQRAETKVELLQSDAAPATPAAALSPPAVAEEAVVSGRQYREDEQAGSSDSRSQQRLDAPAVARRPAAATNSDELDDVAAPQSTSAYFEANDGLIAEAEERARQSLGSDQAYAVEIMQTACDEGQKENPDEWHTCILRLEEQGLHEAALAEREQLAQAFPEFDIPASE